MTGYWAFGKLVPLLSEPAVYYDDSGLRQYGNDVTGENGDLRMENDSFVQVHQRHQQQRRQHREHSLDRISSVTSVPSSPASSSYPKEGNESGLLEYNDTRKQAASNPSHSNYDSGMQLEYDEENNDESLLKNFLLSDTYSLGKGGYRIQTKTE